MVKYENPQKMIDFILDNIFDLLTIGITAYLVVRNAIRPFSAEDIGQLLVWILGVLGLVAISGLWDRHRRLRRIERLMEEGNSLILRRLSGKVYANDFFVPTKLSENMFSSANKIFLAGITLTRTTREFMDVLGQRLKAGAIIKLIIIDRKIDGVVETMASRSMGETTAEYWRTRMQTVESVINTIASTPGASGKLQIGYLPYIPSFGLVIVEPNKPNAVCRVELYHHRSAEPNPTFEVNAKDDPTWYSFFERQYDILWDSCRTEDLPRKA